MFSIKSVLSLGKLDLETFKHLEKPAPLKHIQSSAWRLDNFKFGEHFGDGYLDLDDGKALSNAHSWST